ncbi:TnpV protein [Ruminococcaceae bacterium OttesenSCG-928-L11]|nr:TnpV protein [Ruminococcaceae bacterium OttesenSCG-928-L11]
MNITYTQVGDYQLPNIRLSEAPQELTAPLGRYARMRKAFLKEHRQIAYSRLLLSEKLYPHLREMEESATARMSQIMTSLTQTHSLPDKATNPMEWTAAMNALKAIAEEMILSELVYA